MSRFIITELDKAGIGIDPATYVIAGLPKIELMPRRGGGARAD